MAYALSIISTLLIISLIISGFAFKLFSNNTMSMLIIEFI